MRQLQGIVLLFAFYISVYPQQDTSLILSEIMFIPQSGNNEFIELYNSSTDDTINLNGYKIKYYTASADVITDAGWGTLLSPLTYAVVLEGDYDFTSGIYNNIIPSEALKLKISDNAFGATGMSNTTDRPVQLMDTSSSLIDYRFYTADNAAGYSEEKVVLNHDSLDANWGNSQIFNGTPGKRNSISLLNNDLAISTMYTIPAIPAAGEDVTINAVVKNKGTITAPLFNCSFFNDINFDSIPSPGELIASETYYNLLSGDSLTANTLIIDAAAGSCNIIAKIIFEPDEDTLNNTKCLNFIVYEGDAISDIVFNEIMYAPSGGMPEWLELYNRSDTTVNLKNRKISDNSSSVYITRQDIYLPEDSFAVLSKDSSILDFYSIQSRLLVLPSLPSLNNTGDDIVIRDSAGIHYDSLSYTPDWGGTSGRSLERISSEMPTNNNTNWGTTESLYKGTPGRINSLTPKQYDLRIKTFHTLKTYGIIGEDLIIKTNIKNSGTSASGNYALKLYNDLNKDSTAQPGELFSTISGTSLLSGDSVLYEVQYGGFIVGGNYLIALLDVLSDEDLTNNTAFAAFTGVQINEVRSDLVINEFMYSPSSPEPEWIEIYNRSSKVIEMKNYMTADNRDTVQINFNSLLLYPGQYLVIASDSSILDYYNISSHLLVTNLPSLNNTGDKIILMDSLERVIDSLEYTTTWGIAGRSVERISIDGSSNDSLNWKSCLSKYNGTPGYINSVTPKEYDVTMKSPGSIPPYPVKGDNVRLTAEIKNRGSSTASFDLKLYSDTNLDSLPDAFIETITGLILNSGDSSSYTFNYLINDLDNEYNFYICAEFTGDQDTSNNYGCILIFPGYTPGSVIINEIMYSPEGGEPEWIELFNKMDAPADITSWIISDVYSTPVKTKLNEEIYIQPGGYYVISKDSSITDHHRVIPSGFTTADIPVLNNDRDGVILTDNRGQTMDSLTYDNSWGGTDGHSLERRSAGGASANPFNWCSSEDIEKSTPGRINNKALKQYDLAVTDISFYPRFPVRDDDVNIYAEIKNPGKVKAVNGTINFYMSSSSAASGDSLIGSVNILNLEPDDSLTAASPSGIEKINALHYIRVEVVFINDEDPYNNIMERTVQPGIGSNRIIVNEIMYEPENGEPEWIELQNVSTDSINLLNWTLEDISSGNGDIISSSDLYVLPDEYFILTSDSAFKYLHPGAEYKIITLNNISLGNNGDGVILYDFREGIVDSVSYKPVWGGKNSWSLERILPERASVDSSNWTSCLSTSKSTPGSINSMTNTRNYQRNELIVNEIMANPDIDNCEFIEFVNASNDSINIGGWRIEDEKGSYNKLTNASLMIPSGEYFLLAADSIIYSKYRLSSGFINTLNNSGLGLTNAGELILLKDVKGNIIDSLTYSDRWHSRSSGITKNISLERISPFISSSEKSNWSSSVSPEGATPGKANSILCVNPNSGNNITVSPNPFSPDNDGFEDHCIINYKLNSAAAVRIRIFDSQGREVRTIVNNYSSANTGSVIFDGCNDSGQPLRMGIYIIFLEAVNGYSSSAEVLKTVVVVARKLN